MPKTQDFFDTEEGRNFTNEIAKTIEHSRRKEDFWKSFKGYKIEYLTRKHTKRFRDELKEKGHFIDKEDAEDIICGCIARCYVNYDPAKEAKFETYLHTAVDNALLDYKDRIARGAKRINNFPDLPLYDDEFQVRIPEKLSALLTT